ncbi:MAG TPA: hypothetical protein VF385_03595 [Patescibacteria group bacterium]
MSESWRKIQQFQEEEKRREEAKQRQVELGSLASERRSQLREQEEHKSYEIEHATKWGKIEKAKGIIIPVLQDIINNSQEVRRSRYKDIKVVDDHYLGNLGSDITLRWGNKLDPTKEEMEILEKYRERQEGILGSITGAKLPKEFLREDYNYIEISVSPYHSVGFQRVDWDLDYLIAKPDIIIPICASKLMNSIHKLTKCVKGTDYWRMEEPHHPSSPISQY